MYPKPKHRRFKPKRKRSRDAQLDTIERDGRCRWCGRIDDTLIGHHITAYGAGGEDSPANMITLCARCHGDVGNGYLDMRVCNEPQVLLRGRMVGLNAKDDGGWRLWDANDYLREILNGTE